MNVCVFCGSSTGQKAIYAQTAEALGKQLALNGHSLIYGGGNVGLMGITADAVLKHGGQVVGVIPQFLADREVAHQQLSRLEVVVSMHERKKRMADLSDAFVALPGGWGTLEELAEILTWKQLHLVTQPIAILNVHQFFDPLLLQMHRMVEEGFLQQQNFDSLIVKESPLELVRALHG